MKTAMTTFLSSIMRYDCDRTEGHKVADHTLKFCSISKLTEGVSTQMTKNMFKSVRGYVHRCTQRDEKYKPPVHSTAIDNFTIKINVLSPTLNF